MLEKLIAAMAVPEIRKRVQFVFMIFAIYVLALHIPATGVNQEAVDRLLRSGTLFGAIDVFSGGALKKFSIIAMGIMPYISASIIMQLLTVAIPQLRTLSKEGESGRKQISKYTRYATIVLALVQALGLHALFAREGAIARDVWTMLTVIITLTAGTMFLLWLGEQITEKGIGNGVSLMIFVGIMVSIPTQLRQMIGELQAGAVSPLGVLAVLALFLATIVGIIYMTQAVRKIPVHHVKRIVGNRMSQGGASFLPLKVNTAGVIPIIFALQIQLFPATFAQFVPLDYKLGSAPVGLWIQSATAWLQPGESATASVLFAALIFFFTYFYTAIQYDTDDMADNLKKYGSFVPGVRPGKDTSEYFNRVLTRITLAAAIFLSAVALIQYWAPVWTGVQSFGLIGGTSLLIVVGVALETMQAIEAQMAMRNYEGFIKQQGSGGGGAGGLLVGAR